MKRFSMYGLQRYPGRSYSLDIYSTAYRPTLKCGCIEHVLFSASIEIFKVKVERQLSLLSLIVVNLKPNFYDLNFKYYIF